MFPRVEGGGKALCSLGGKPGLRVEGFGEKSDYSNSLSFGGEALRCQVGLRGSSFREKQQGLIKQ
jgi:hypothetical protein